MKVVIDYDRHGNVRKISGDVGQTRMNRAAYTLWRGEIEPSFGYKLRRFFRRLYNTALALSDRAADVIFEPERIEYIESEPNESDRAPIFYLEAKHE